jgi:hypothetical protein
MLPAHPVKLEEALVLLPVSAASVEEVPRAVGDDIEDGVVVEFAEDDEDVAADEEFCEVEEPLALGWLPLLTFAPPAPQATLKDRPSMRMPKKSFFIFCDFSK